MLQELSSPVARVLLDASEIEKDSEKESPDDHTSILHRARVLQLSPTVEIRCLKTSSPTPSYQYYMRKTWRLSRRHYRKFLQSPRVDAKMQIFRILALAILMLSCACMFLIWMQSYFNRREPEAAPLPSPTYTLTARASYYLPRNDSLYPTQREQMRKMFLHAWNGYLQHSRVAESWFKQTQKFKLHDELMPLTCKGTDFQNIGLSITLIDAADTLVVLGELDLFADAVLRISQIPDFNVDGEVNAFETGIRVLGGLLSSHLLAKEIFVEYDDKLLNLAVDLADRLLFAFDDDFNIPSLHVNLNRRRRKRHNLNSPAGAGSFLLEFGYLTKLTGNPVYYRKAKNAAVEIFAMASKKFLLGRTLDRFHLYWINEGSGIGGEFDSFFEYLWKGYLIFHDEDLLVMFKVLYDAIGKYIQLGGAHPYSNMNTGKIQNYDFTMLESFWAGLQVLYGDVDSARMKLEYSGFFMKDLAVIAESIDLNTHSKSQFSYLGRPELIESLAYMTQAFSDVGIVRFAQRFMERVDNLTKTSCGYASIKEIRPPVSLSDEQNSFFLSETLKYAYLSFDQNNVFWRGAPGKTYLFTTEAHPLPILVKTEKQRFRKSKKIKEKIQNSTDVSVRSVLANLNMSYEHGYSLQKSCSYLEWKSTDLKLLFSPATTGYDWLKIEDIC